MQVNDFKNYEFLRADVPIKFVTPDWVKNYDDNFRKPLLKKKYDDVWELIKKKNNW